MERVPNGLDAKAPPSSATRALDPPATVPRSRDEARGRTVDAIARVSLTGRLLGIDPTAARLFGGDDPAPLVGRRFGELGLPRAVAARCLRGVRRVVRGRGDDTFDVGLDFDGPRQWTVRIVPELDADGTIVAALLVVRDVAPRPIDAAAAARADDAARARDHFIATVSHELRSPLNGIQSWSHVLEKQLEATSTTSVERRALAGIRAGIDRQVLLIDQLLEAAVVLTGDRRIAQDPLSVREAVEAAVARARASALVKGVALHVNLQLTDERSTGEARRIEQVFDHLLSNAVQRTPQGGAIRLSARRVADSATVVVRDDGSGVPADLQRWWFEAFPPDAVAAARRVDGIGLGLGLAVARRLTELHGGTIAVASAGPDRGTTFTVTLPLRVGAADV